MELQEILSQVDGFTPPSVTVQIEKVFPRKAGTSDKGDWSFQSVKVSGGELKLKNLDELPSDRVGAKVTLKAFSSPKHGLTGMKVAHEEYQGKTFDKLVITPTCIWEWAEPGKSNGNGHHAPASAPQAARSESRANHDENFDRDIYRAIRIDRMVQAMNDAKEVVHAINSTLSEGEPPDFLLSGQDIRAIAISFVIDEQRQYIPFELPKAERPIDLDIPAILEAIKQELTNAVPGQSDEDKTKRLDLLEKSFGKRSWQAVTQLSGAELSTGLAVLKVEVEEDLPF